MYYLLGSPKTWLYHCLHAKRRSLPMAAGACCGRLPSADSLARLLSSLLPLKGCLRGLATDLFSVPSVVSESAPWLWRQRPEPQLPIAGSPAGRIQARRRWDRLSVPWIEAKLHGLTCSERREWYRHAGVSRPLLQLQEASSCLQAARRPAASGIRAHR